MCFLGSVLGPGLALLIFPGAGTDKVGCPGEAGLIFVDPVDDDRVVSCSCPCSSIHKAKLIFLGAGVGKNATGGFSCKTVSVACFLIPAIVSSSVVVAVLPGPGSGKAVCPDVARLIFLVVDETSAVSFVKAKLIFLGAGVGKYGSSTTASVSVTSISTVFFSSPVELIWLGACLGPYCLFSVSTDDWTLRLCSKGLHSRNSVWFWFFPAEWARLSFEPSLDTEKLFLLRVKGLRIFLDDSGLLAKKCTETLLVGID